MEVHDKKSDGYAAVNQVQTIPWSESETIPAHLTVVLSDAPKPEQYPPLNPARVSTWKWYNPVSWAFALLRWAFSVDERFQTIANDLKGIVEGDQPVREKAAAARTYMNELSWCDRFRIGRWDDRFRKITMATLGGSLANMERPDLEHNGQTHKFMRYRRVETEAGESGSWKYEVDNQRGLPTSYQPGAQMDDIGNLRIVVDGDNRPIAGGCSIPNDPNKALEAVLPMIRAKMAAGELEDGDEVPIIVHSLLSPTIFTSDETKMLKQEIEAYKALADIKELTIQDGERKVTIKLVPMVINTQANFFNAVRNVPVASSLGYNTSDDLTLPGFTELAKRGRKVDSESVEKLKQGRIGTRLSAPEEAKLLQGLAQSMGGIYIAHCKSGLDRTSLILAQVLKTDEDDAKEMIDAIFTPVTFMSTGFCGFKWEDKKSVGREVVGSDHVDSYWKTWLGNGRLRKS